MMCSKGPSVSLETSEPKARDEGKKGSKRKGGEVSWGSNKGRGFRIWEQTGIATEDLLDQKCDRGTFPVH